MIKKDWHESLDPKMSISALVIQSSAISVILDQLSRSTEKSYHEQLTSEISLILDDIESFMNLLMYILKLSDDHDLVRSYVKFMILAYRDRFFVQESNPTARELRIGLKYLKVENSLKVLSVNTLINYQAQTNQIFKRLKAFETLISSAFLQSIDENQRNILLRHLYLAITYKVDFLDLHEVDFEDQRGIVKYGDYFWNDEDVEVLDIDNSRGRHFQPSQ